MESEKDVDYMKILEKAVMPNGTEIQLEDWKDDNTSDYPNLYGLTIGAYPIVKNTPNKWDKDIKKFRLTIAMNHHTGYTNEDVKADFEALKNGIKFLEDLANHFWNGEKDMWYLGMNVEYKGW